MVEAQLERTVLAWNRSSLAVAGNGGLLVHAGFRAGVFPFAVIGFAVITVAVFVFALTMRQYAAARKRRATHLVKHSPAAMAALAGFVVALSAADVVAAVAL